MPAPGVAGTAVRKLVVWSDGETGAPRGALKAVHELKAMHPEWADLLESTGIYGGPHRNGSSVTHEQAHRWHLREAKSTFEADQGHCYGIDITIAFRDRPAGEDEARVERNTNCVTFGFWQALIEPLGTSRNARGPLHTRMVFDGETIQPPQWDDTLKVTVFIKDKMYDSLPETPTPIPAKPEINRELAARASSLVLWGQEDYLKEGAWQVASGLLSDALRHELKNAKGDKTRLVVYVTGAEELPENGNMGIEVVSVDIFKTVFSNIVVKLASEDPQARTRRVIAWLVVIGVVVLLIVGAVSYYVFCYKPPKEQPTKKKKKRRKQAREMDIELVSHGHPADVEEGRVVSDESAAMPPPSTSEEPARPTAKAKEPARPTSKAKEPARPAKAKATHTRNATSS